MFLSKLDAKHGQWEGRLTDALAWWNGGCKGIAKSDASHVKESGSGWRGGTVESMLAACGGDIDMDPYQKAMERIAPTMRQFKAEHASMMIRRSRRLDETDGDWQYDRRWEEKPFMRTIRQPSSQKVIKLDVNMCVSGGVDAKEIDAYGATVWAVAQCLAAMGRRTEITWIAANAKGYGTNYTVRIILKKPNEYLAPSLLASTLTTNFYRRMGFGLCYYACEGNGIKAPMGLGPTLFLDPITYKDGVLTFCPARAYYDGGVALQDAIRKAITQEDTQKASA